MSIFRSFSEGLAKTRKNLSDKLGSIILGEKIDESYLEELEEVLISSDLGVKSSSAALADLKERFRRKELTTADQVRDRLKQVLKEIIAAQPSRLSAEPRPFTILMVGANGTGKTTSIGKLAARFRNEGRNVILAAADTFRAAASEQLSIWGTRAEVPVIKHREGADPGAVVYDAIAAMKARQADMLIVDTAGRLHTKSNLMEELKKIKRIMSRELPGAPHETLLVLDANTGQNALVQAKMFNEAVGITGITLTKLDGTSKGGIVFAIVKELMIPVKLIGIGEAIEDLRDFDPNEFVDALFDSR